MNVQLAKHFLKSICSANGGSETDNLSPTDNCCSRHIGQLLWMGQTRKILENLHHISIKRQMILSNYECPSDNTDIRLLSLVPETSR